MILQTTMKMDNLIGFWTFRFLIFIFIKDQLLSKSWYALCLSFTFIDFPQKKKKLKIKKRVKITYKGNEAKKLVKGIFKHSEARERDYFSPRFSLKAKRMRGRIELSWLYFRLFCECFIDVLSITALNVSIVVSLH